MSQIDTEMELSEDTDQDTKLVPVMESIRYRKRAQSAEKKAKVLSEQLVVANQNVTELSEQISSLQTEQKLIHKLYAAGAVDLETAVLLAKAKVQDKGDVEIDACIEQLRKEKQYLFTTDGTAVTPAKTAVVKDRMSPAHTVLERSAKKAARTGNRADLQEYLKLRRNFL